MIDFQINNGIATIKISRPETFNSINQPTAFALQKALDDCQADASIRTVILTGEGRAFCAGQDLGEITDPKSTGLKRVVEDHYNPIILKIRALAKPVIAAVNGVAAGAGANIALACDIVIAKESASFIQAFSKIGLNPDSGGSYFLPRLVGMQRATALMFLGDKVSAKDAQDMGMIYRCVPDADFESIVHQISTQLANMPTQGLANTKALLNQSFDNNLEQQLAAEGVYQVKSSQTADYKEGVQAFLEKRKPVFIGK